MWYVFGFTALIIVIIAVRSKRTAARLARLAEARNEYDKNVYALGTVAARAQCKHEFIQLGQTGVPGVITLTTRWCRVCGEDLGSAKLKRSIFGSHWE
ncbi:hypothetical protein DVJ77_10110 [Dyella tabacisoli]|uniref:Uncharacterized protein n=1 Tax=Dyella tabacisoli TaxID=2282381 RepID=A0A369ULR0_9GAMM|nr:hypothetical protein DVJ77_10110 [Dyella tabacisoli]